MLTTAAMMEYTVHNLVSALGLDAVGKEGVVRQDAIVAVST